MGLILSSPSQTPQFPGLLNGYAAKPSFTVPGVDYGVGPRSSVTLRDPYQGLAPTSGNLHPTLVAAGGSGGAPLITFSGAGATISGWDFSGNSGTGYGGVGVVINAANITLTDCNFLVGSNQRCPIVADIGATGNCTIRYTKVDGGKMWHDPAGSLIQTPGLSGTMLIENCWIRNSHWQHISFGAGTAQTATILRYCVLENAGYGSPHPIFSGYIDNGAGGAGTILTVTSTAATINLPMTIWDSLGAIASGAGFSTYLVNQLTGSAGGTGTYTVSRSQLLGSAGSLKSFTTGESYNVGGHGDWAMLNGGSGSTNYGAISAYNNLFLQNELAARAATQGYSYGGQAGAHAVCDSFDFSRNVTITLSTANTNWQWMVDYSLLKNNAVATANNNYADPSGSGTFWNNSQNGGLGPWSGSLSKSGNIKMTDGTTL